MRLRKLSSDSVVQRLVLVRCTNPFNLLSRSPFLIPHTFNLNFHLHQSATAQMSTQKTQPKPRNARRNFNGNLTTSSTQPPATSTASSTPATASESEQEPPKVDNNKGQSVPLPMPPPGLSKASEAPAVDVDQAICFICAEPVSIWALGPCSHRTCHTCTLRLRALFKNRECTFCKVGHNVTQYKTNNVNHRRSRRTLYS